MTDFNTFDVLKRLTEAHGVAGNETSAALVALELLKKYAPDAKIDRHGSVVGSLPAIGGNSDGDSATVLLDAHIDQVGLIVTYIDDKAFVKAASCGGIDVRALKAGAVTIHGKSPVKGVVCAKPPHVLKKDEADKPLKSDEIWIDTGLGATRVKELISPGDTATVDGEFLRLRGSTVSAPALDNRAGVCAVLYALHTLKAEETAGTAASLNAKRPRICAAFSVQEELGCRGAAITAYNADPEYAVVVDVSFGFSHGVEDEKGNSIGKLGGGPMIGYAPSLNREMFEGLKKTAGDKNIPYQLEIMSRDTSGTNADPISIVKGGVKTALVSIPLRYMHTPVEVADIKDIEAVGRLIAEYVKGLGIKN